MKVLSLHQPYASLVVHGFKKFETRSWFTRYRGHLLIHSTKSKELLHALDESPTIQRITRENEIQYPRGVILGSVTLSKCLLFSAQLCHQVMKDYPAEVVLGIWATGRFMWALKDPEVWEKPIPARGHQRIWNWDLDAPT